MCVHNENTEGDTPLLIRSIRGDLNGTQYAKGRYAVRRNSVISYADINFYFKKVQFSLKRNNTLGIQSQISLKKLRARFAGAFWAHFNIYKLKHGFYDWGRSTSRKFNKKTNKN